MDNYIIFATAIIAIVFMLIRFSRRNSRNSRPVTRTKTKKIIKSYAPENEVDTNLKSFPVAVVGESKFQDNLIEICGPYSRTGISITRQGVIKAEPDNPDDPDAVRVEIEQLLIGYVQRKHAGRVAEAMRRAGISEAGCECRIRGGWRTNQFDHGPYGAWLKIPRRTEVAFRLTIPRPGTNGDSA